jgi:nucleotide-binding universal stress UspA family protein
MSERPIVVALDGSELAEGALPYAQALARATGAPLLLTTVWEGTEAGLAGTLPAVAIDLERSAAEYYEQYLDRVASRLRRARVQVDTAFRIGHPVEEIVALAERVRASMVVLATHGRSGVGRWVYGSSASRLLREATRPTLVVGPKALKAKGPPRIRRILLPLDGSSQAEAAIKPAGELASQTGATIVVARAIQFASMAPPFGVPETYIPEIEQDLVKGASAYLDRAVGKLASGVKVKTLVLRGFPSDQLLKVIDAERIDLVVMTSHTRKGPARAILGSVADRMLHGSAPVLLIRPPAARASAKKQTASKAKGRR